MLILRPFYNTESTSKKSIIHSASKSLIPVVSSTGSDCAHACDATFIIESIAVKQLSSLLVAVKDTFYSDWDVIFNFPITNWNRLGSPVTSPRTYKADMLTCCVS